ncbi:ankyrin [Daldinia caldariorum]|uniref:ankyrin n=1 Tax=Daldinia caldariorum TaxID=326644 RepID=UPI00200775D0|nr:ankyrin [Daldinia caldariorum]KAI1464460.1 ankyrin [Daldinia caldariorum]
MARLIDLPVELLQEIGNARFGNYPVQQYFIDKHEDDKLAPLILRTRDLLSLTFTCRAFYEVFHRLLYIFGAKCRRHNLFDRAAEAGNLIALKRAVSFKLEPILLSYDENKSPWADLLDTACEYGQRDVAEWLLDRGVPLEEEEWLDRDAQVTLKACEPLMLAMKKRYDDVAILLLSRGANPLPTTERGTSRSLLHYAAGWNMIHLVEYLVGEMGLSIDLPDYKEFTPLRYMMRYTKTPDTDTAMINKLIELGADVNTEVYGELPLTSAITRGKYRHAIILLEAGSKVKPNRPFRNVKGPLQALIWSTKTINTGNKRATGFIIIMDRERGQLGPCTISKFEAQKTVLQKLVDAGRTPLEEAFLHGSKDKESVDAIGLLGLYLKDFSKKIEFLLENGARIDIPLSNGQTYFQWLIDFKDYYKLKWLGKLLALVSKSMDKSMLDQKHLNSVLQEAYKAIHGPEKGRYFYIADVLEMLIPYGAVIEDPADMDCLTLWSLECDSLPDSLIPMFNSRIPDENLSDLLIEALERGSPKWIDYLLDRIEPNFDASRRNPQWIRKAVEYSKAPAITRLLQGISALDINHVAEDGMTPLVRSFRLFGTDHLWKVLLEYGADPFLSAKHPICANMNSSDFDLGIDYHIVREAQGVSAFEIMLHYHPWDIKEFWDASTAKDRPDPRLFVSCLDGWDNFRKKSETIEWMKMTSVGEYFSSWVALLAEIDTEDGGEYTE